MSANPTVLVLGRRRADNMPSLTRMLEILKPRKDAVPGMDATVSSSVRIMGANTIYPVVMGQGTATCPDCLGPAHAGPCPRPQR